MSRGGGCQGQLRWLVLCNFAPWLVVGQSGDLEAMLISGGSRLQESTRNAGAASGCPCFPPSSAQLACPFFLHLSSFSHIVGRRVPPTALLVLCRRRRRCRCRCRCRPSSHRWSAVRREIIAAARSPPRSSKAKTTRQIEQRKARPLISAAREGGFPIPVLADCGSGARRSPLRRSPALRALEEHADTGHPPPWYRRELHDGAVLQGLLVAGLGLRWEKGDKINGLRRCDWPANA